MCDNCPSLRGDPYDNLKVSEEMEVKDLVCFLAHLSSGIVHVREHSALF